VVRRHGIENGARVVEPGTRLAADAMSGVYEQGAAECRRIGVGVWNVAETVTWLAQA
jgi:hypothetical protein